MKFTPIAIAALAALPASVALAENDCHLPRAAWQSQGAATQAAAAQGWRVDKVEVDDGCWEIKGVDAQGRRIRAKLDPATLELVKLRSKDGERGRERDHRRDGGRAPAAAPSAPAVNPLFQNGAPPVVRVN